MFRDFVSVARPLLWLPRLCKSGAPQCITIQKCGHGFEGSQSHLPFVASGSGPRQGFIYSGIASCTQAHCTSTRTTIRIEFAIAVWRFTHGYWKVTLSDRWYHNGWRRLKCNFSFLYVVWLVGQSKQWFREWSWASCTPCCQPAAHQQSQNCRST